MVVIRKSKQSGSLFVCAEWHRGILAQGIKDGLVARLKEELELLQRSLRLHRLGGEVQEKPPQKRRLQRLGLWLRQKSDRNFLNFVVGHSFRGVGERVHRNRGLQGGDAVSPILEESKRKKKEKKKKKVQDFKNPNHKQRQIRTGGR